VTGTEHSDIAGMKRMNMIIIKTSQELQLMRESNRLVAEALQEIKKLVVADITTEELDRFAEDFIRRRGGQPAFKGYRGYPASLCVSVNEEIVHGIPGRKKLCAGDIVSLDLGVLMNGFYGDAAITVPVGSISPQVRKLLQVTEESLYRGIEQAQVGNRLLDISRAIQAAVESRGFSVVRDFVGHGIGRNLHEDPQIPNFYSTTAHNPRLQEGMVFALEPMVNEGSHKMKILSDEWTAVTADRKLSAHFEHTVAITASGPWILSSPDHEKKSLPLAG
jgi:methionyl aminopeptidase